MKLGAAKDQSRRPTLPWTFIFGFFVLSWLLFFFLHPAALTKVGVGHYRIEIAPARFHEIWFLDTLAILASNDAVTAGADPYVRNPLDYFHRPHVYGPLWLHLHYFGVTRADTRAIGLGLVAAFVAAVLLFLRPRCPGSLLWYIVIFCTTPMLAAMERGNNDLVVFLLLMPVVPCLLSARPFVRWLALPLILLAVDLKYYPAATGLILLANADARELRRRLVVAVGLFAIVAWHVMANFHGLALLPKPRGVLTFGAAGLFREWGVAGLTPQVFVAAVAGAAVILWWRSSVFDHWRPDASSSREWLYFVLGGLILTGCFFAGQHFAYRWIFAIWMAPLLWKVPRDGTAPAPVRKLARAIMWSLLVILWMEAVLVFVFRQWLPDQFSPALRWIYFGMQPITWFFFLCVLGFLVHFVRSRLRNALGDPVRPPIRAFG